MRFYLFLIIFCAFEANSQVPDANLPDHSAPETISGMELIWQEEFNYSGLPDSSKWDFERGFVRNEELQWYQKENARVANGVLTITGKRVSLANPFYKAESGDWRSSRKEVIFTSSSIKTQRKASWKFGTFIIRARIDTTLGAWPAIWTLGMEKPWPSNGEIDIMEFYRRKNMEPIILANTAWGTEKQWIAKWDERKVPLSHFTNRDSKWVEKFHIWKMEWTPESIKLYLDDELLNETSLEKTINPDGFNPFHQAHYLLLNLAIGGTNGGWPKLSTTEIKYEVDYVRVYREKS